MEKNINPQAYRTLLKAYTNLREENETLTQRNVLLGTHISRLLYILECERTQQGISLDLRYQTEYFAAKEALSNNK